MDLVLRRLLLLKKLRCWGLAMKVDINAIKVYPRFRKDKGNLENLADSIKSIGLLQPIGITVDNVLVYGERRFLACR
ncbi:MAG: ParB N-terminal domain-containing protein, partial [Magnetococcales bacterium]|nr:ParB N-terminal domain-containing protein [Magnetococcales bacterium]